MKLLIFVLVCCPLLLHAQTAREIVQRADEKLRGNTSKADVLVMFPNQERAFFERIFLSGTAQTLFI